MALSNFDILVLTVDPQPIPFLQRNASMDAVKNCIAVVSRSGGSVNSTPVQLQGEPKLPPRQNILGTVGCLTLLQKKIFGVIAKSANLFEPSQPADFGLENSVKETIYARGAVSSQEKQPLPVDLGDIGLELVIDVMVWMPVLKGASAVKPPQQRLVGQPI